MADQQGKASNFDNQKQLRASRQQENLAHLSSDESRDDRVEAANQASVMDVQPFLGFPFMHPMHDASIDQQLAPRALRHNARRNRDNEAISAEAPGRAQNALGADEVPPGQAH